MRAGHGECNSDDRVDQRDHGIAVGMGLCVSSEGAKDTMGGFRRRASELCSIES